MHTISKLGAAALIVGAVLLVGPTFGFSSIAADRGMDVTIAGDEREALVGLEVTGEEVAHPNDATVAIIHNNLDSEMTLETEIDEGDFSIVSGFDKSLSAAGEDGDSTGLIIECGNVRGDGEKVIPVTVTLAEAEQLGIQIEQATIDIPVSHQCPGQSTGAFQPRDILPGDNTGEVVFDIENTGQKGFRISGVSIDWTSSSADRIGSGNEGVIEIGDQTLQSSDWNIGSSSTDGDRVDFDGNGAGSRVNVDAGQTVSVEIFEFSQGNTPIDMQEEEFDITFYDDRRSRQPITITVEVPCDAGSSDCSDTNSNVVVSDGDQTNNDIKSSGDISIGEGSTANNGVKADGDVTANDRATIHGNDETPDEAIEASNDVTIGDDATVSNGIDAGGDVTIGDRTTVHPYDESDNGAIEAGGTVWIGEDSTVSDDIIAGSDIHLGDGSTVYGDIDAGGTIFIGCSVTITGETITENIVEEC